MSAAAAALLVFLGLLYAGGAIASAIVRSAPRAYDDTELRRELRAIAQELNALRRSQPHELSSVTPAFRDPPQQRHDCGCMG